MECVTHSFCLPQHALHKVSLVCEDKHRQTDMTKLSALSHMPKMNAVVQQWPQKYKHTSWNGPFWKFLPARRSSLGKTM